MGLLGRRRAAPAGTPAGLRGDVARLFSAKGVDEGRPTLARALERVVTRPGPLAIVLYRLSHQLWRRGLETPAEVVWRLNYFVSGADIHPGAEIGGGLRVVHTAGLVVGRGVRIGADVSLLHGVTLGGSGRSLLEPTFPDGYPDIGDGTMIFAGAKVLGPIRVGRGCFIGANAVVGKDLPDGAVVTAGQGLGELRRTADDHERRLDELERRLEAMKRPAEER